MKRVIAYLLAAMALVFAAASCGNDDGVVVPPPGPGNKTAVDEGNGNGDGNGEGNGDGTGTTDSGTETSATANLCKEEYLGQKPMIIAYLTEYTSASSLDASCLTHINYAHGRFKNPKTGDGGIVIAEPTLLKKVVALKEKKPSLKVLLMIGGWGEHADGFSMMARDAAKRTEFCQSCKAHIDTYGLDG